MSSFATAAGFLAAELDLKLVESVLGAIRTADIQSGQDKKSPLPIVTHALPAEPARVYRDDVVIRNAVERAAAPALYSHHRCALASPAAASMPVVVEVIVQKVADELCSPLAPPWKSLPWNQPSRSPAKIKIIRYRPDICAKGTVLDCFI